MFCGKLGTTSSNYYQSTANAWRGYAFYTQKSELPFVFHESAWRPVMESLPASLAPEQLNLQKPAKYKAEYVVKWGRQTSEETDESLIRREAYQKELEAYRRAKREAKSRMLDFQWSEARRFDKAQELLITQSNAEPIQITDGTHKTFYLYRMNIYEFDGTQDTPAERIEMIERYESTSSASEDAQQSPGRISASVRSEVWQRDGGSCVSCGSKESLGYSFIIPIEQGGDHAARNVELLCDKCDHTEVLQKSRK